MPKIDQDTKQKRKDLVYECVLRHDAGITEKEIDELLALGRRNVNNYLRELEIEGKVERQGHVWIGYLYRRTTLRRFEISPEEAMTLYLATRLLVKQHDKRNESAQTALVKLAEVLTGDVGVGYEIHQAALELAHRPGDESYSRIFRAVMQGYIYRRKLAITYEPLGGTAFETVLSPYLLEPSAIGYATYVIGHSSVVNALRTYKLERIRAAALTREEYRVPADFPGLEYLRSAWSIISGEETVQVKVRFAPGVAAQRVRESYWHPSQQIVDDPEHPGGCFWSAQVADVLDFKPWLRSWGGDVEVLEPPALREELRREVRKMARVYGVEIMQKFPPYFYLYGKSDYKDPKRMHRLIYHLVDVGQVAGVFWQAVLPAPFKTQMAAWLGLSIEEAGRLLIFLAAIHDLGKASPAFQIKLPYAPPELRPEGFTIPEKIEKPTRHEVITAWAIQEEKLLEAEIGLSEFWAQRIAQALSGHHGVWQPYQTINSTPDAERGGAEWAAARHGLVRELKALFNPPVCNPQLKPVEQNALLTLLSGFVSVVDWLGSDEDIFAYYEELMPLDVYVHKTEQKAWEGLRQKAWLSELPAPEDFDFTALFELPAPSAIQQRVIELTRTVTTPALVIIESPTGSGKTEAALSLYALWTQAVEHPGLYMAMPTTATSDQMHDRITKFLSWRHQTEVKPLLVHSRALLREADVHKDAETAEDDERAEQQSWFLPRKKSLLAAFGVGTVDQTFLSVLQTRHFFVRLFGLSNKVVIFDEVHAYDAYMSEIFCRLLMWLRYLGTSVILLSATLPDAMRRRFVEAYTGVEDTSAPVAYPRLTIATPAQTQVEPLPAPEARPPLELTCIARDLDTIIQQVRDALQSEGCVAVICNTVRRAQQVYLALQEVNATAPFCPEETLILFHARTKQTWRDETQTTVLRALSKEARQSAARPPRMVVVATQVVEQSLDLDFDVMLTDLAPLDLLVQRAGRLQRHPPHERAHPYRLLITMPKMKGEVPAFARTDFPYEPLFLFRTWAVLRDRVALTLTEDAPRLIEQVYGDEALPGLTPALLKAMDEAQHDWEAERAAAVRSAGKQLVVEPHKPTLLAKVNLELEDDNPDASRALQVMTRRGAPGLTLICLHRVNGQVCLDPEGQQPVDAEQPTKAQIAQLARCGVNVQSQPVVAHFAPQEPPRRWRKIAALRHARLAIFDYNHYESDRFSLQLTRPLGLQIDYHQSGGEDDEL